MSPALWDRLQDVSGLVGGMGKPDGTRHAQEAFLEPMPVRDTRQKPPAITVMLRGERLPVLPLLISGAFFGKPPQPRGSMGYSGRGSIGIGCKKSPPMT